MSLTTEDQLERGTRMYSKLSEENFRAIIGNILFGASTPEGQRAYRGIWRQLEIEAYWDIPAWKYANREKLPDRIGYVQQGQDDADWLESNLPAINDPTVPGVRGAANTILDRYPEVFPVSLVAGSDSDAIIEKAKTWFYGPAQEEPPCPTQHLRPIHRPKSNNRPATTSDRPLNCVLSPR